MKNWFLNLKLFSIIFVNKKPTGFWPVDCNFYLFLCEIFDPKAKKINWSPFGAPQWKTLINQGFLFKGTLFDRLVSANSKGKWWKLFVFAIFFVFCFMLILRLFRGDESVFLRFPLPCPILQYHGRRFGFFEWNILNIFWCVHWPQFSQ